MTFLIIVLVILGSACLYLTVGAIVAIKMRRAIVAAASYAPGDVYREWRYDQWDVKTRTTSGVNRGEVRQQSYRMLFGWPVHVWWFLFNRNLTRDLDQADPEVLAHRIQATEQWLSEQQQLSELEQ